MRLNLNVELQAGSRRHHQTGPTPVAAHPGNIEQSQLSLQQAMEIVQGATIQAGQQEYDKMPDDKKQEILEQGAQWRQQIQDQFEAQRTDENMSVKSNPKK